MKKYIFISVTLFLFLSERIFAQQVVVDVATSGAVVNNTVVVKGGLKKINNTQDKIKSAQLSMAYFLKFIQETDKKIYKSLKTVQSIVLQGKNIALSYSIGKDIFKYLNNAVEIAKGDPSLLPFAIKDAKTLTNRVTDLGFYITNVVRKGGDKNLMSNMDRQEIIRHVLNELRVMRGIAFGISRHMYYAQYGNRLKNLMREFNIKSYSLDEIEKYNTTKDLKIW